MSSETNLSLLIDEAEPMLQEHAWVSSQARLDKGQFLLKPNIVLIAERDVF